MTSEVNKKTKALLLSWFCGPAGLNDRFGQSLANLFTRLYTIEDVENVLRQVTVTGKFGDFLMTKANDGAFKSRIARNFGRAELCRENEIYHHNLALTYRTFDKGPDGLVVVDLGELGDVWKD